ncbi:MAG TPA: twin-arginine translocase TatA/TatE family subunit [Dehalococcoidia bacterium]|jgi:sec-independent protein translocase protein TatA|nr:twin-arginine translocase TatA/TatE family subunit [Dehalococcoidia bacterium]HIK98360.1 twin-arginine translocase TatA/TatE family subunit [Dehalococcoidia bacterium]
MPRIGPLELIIVLVIIVVVFGIGRLPEVGGGLGKGIREFRRSLTGKNDDDGDDAGDGKNGI